MARTSAAPGGAVRAPAAKSRKKPVTITAKQREEGEEGTISKHWRTYFLQALAETSNVKASAVRAGCAPSRAYKARREDPDFAAQWRVALLEGYEHLELEVLGWLRGAEPERKFDIANAIRLLAAHRAEAAQQRALLDDCDEQAVLESIDAMIDEMRRRSIDNARLLAAPETTDDPHRQ